MGASSSVAMLTAARRRELWGAFEGKALLAGEWSTCSALKSPILADEGGRIKEDVVDFVRQVRVKLTGLAKARVCLAIMASFGNAGENEADEVAERKKRAFLLVSELAGDDKEDDWARATAQIVKEKFGGGDSTDLIKSAKAEVFDEIAKTSSASDGAKFCLEGDLAPLHWGYLAGHMLPTQFDASVESNKDYAPAEDIIDAALPSPSQRARLRKALPVRVATIPAAPPPESAPPESPSTPQSWRSATPPAPPTPSYSPNGTLNTAAMFDGANKLTAEGKSIVQAFLKGGSCPKPGHGELRVLFSEKRRLVNKDGKTFIKREQVFFKLDYSEGASRSRIPKVKKVSHIPYSAVKRKVGMKRPRA